MKHEGEHKIDFACLGCVRKHIEHKEKLLKFVKEIADYDFKDSVWDIEAKELLESIEADNENSSSI